jgi:hypothetical protein
MSYGVPMGTAEGFSEGSKGRETPYPDAYDPAAEDKSTGQSTNTESETIMANYEPEPMPPSEEVAASADRVLARIMAPKPVAERPQGVAQEPPTPPEPQAAPIPLPVPTATHTEPPGPTGRPPKRRWNGAVVSTTPSEPTVVLDAATGLPPVPLKPGERVSSGPEGIARLMALQKAGLLDSSPPTRRERDRSVSRKSHGDVPPTTTASDESESVVALRDFG